MVPEDEPFSRSRRSFPKRMRRSKSSWVSPGCFCSRSSSSSPVSLRGVFSDAGGGVAAASTKTPRTPPKNPPTDLAADRNFDAGRAVTGAWDEGALVADAAGEVAAGTPASVVLGIERQICVEPALHALRAYYNSCAASGCAPVRP